MHCLTRPKFLSYRKRSDRSTTNGPVFEYLAEGLGVGSGDFVNFVGRIGREGVGEFVVRRREGLQVALNQSARILGQRLDLRKRCEQQMLCTLRNKVCGSINIPVRKQAGKGGCISCTPRPSRR